MPFVLTIFIVVLAITIVVGVLGFLIDRSAAKHDRT